MLCEFDVLQATGGAQGLQVLEDHLPDVVICDIVMPSMDGYEVVRAIRINSRTAHLPEIISSAHSEGRTVN